MCVFEYVPEEVAHNQNSMHSDLAVDHTEHVSLPSSRYDVHSLFGDILTQQVEVGIVQFLWCTCIVNVVNLCSSERVLYLTLIDTCM